MKQIDTTFDAGYKEVMLAYFAGEEIQVDHGDDKWMTSETHPRNWRSCSVHRIAPARVPKVGEVWKNGGVFILVIEASYQQTRYMYQNYKSSSMNPDAFVCYYEYSHTPEIFKDTE